VAEQTLREIREIRLGKLERLEKIQKCRYPNHFRATHSIAEVKGLAKDLGHEDLAQKQVVVSVAGRVMAINSFGKSVFLRIKDETGLLQIYAKLDVLGAEWFEKVRLTDIGDIIGVQGRIFRTKTEELTVNAHEYWVLTKCLRPLPEKWHGLKDEELRQRQRYLDLIINEESRRVFVARTKIVKFFRDYLDKKGFLEVETPMMHPVLGGANARPFITHHNALDMELYLRIAPELYLKRLVVGGFERVYEINRNFRNEGLSTRHNPEFTMLEFYQAFATYEDLMEMTEEMFRLLVSEVCGSLKIDYLGTTLDFSERFERLSVLEALRHYCKADDSVFSDPKTAMAFAKNLGIEEAVLKEIEKKHAQDARDMALRVCMEVFEKVVEDKLCQPTFVYGYPLVVSPLARRNDKDPYLCDRFEFFVAGGEVANAFSELNDPLDQAERFRQQLRAKGMGDEEAMEYDEDYIRALEYGLCPTAGEGIGIDRVTMILTNQSNIRDVILFPLMREQEPSGE
jgi:lysyl-tRNA synthetase class 2